MNIALIASYPPRECGIATFTQNLLHAIDGDEHTVTSVIAMNDVKNVYEYYRKVIFTINQDDQQDYTKAADFINQTNIDVCVLQHEYGIFGGESGIYILSLIQRLKTPFIATLHTVLKEPSFLQKVIMQEIANSAYKVVVMSRMAITFLTEIYNIPEDKIILIEHGVPVLKQQLYIRELSKFRNKRILFTFGLLSRNKGIETVIKALPEVVKKHPDIIYVVLGNTHPAVVRHSGEEYRNFLKRLACDLKVDNNVFFINSFVTDEQLFSYLKSIEIYITPYNNEAQITSGTLSYAIGAGAATVSTPYWHAQDLLAENRGRLFPFKDSEVLSDTLNELLDDADELNAIRANAFEYGRHLKWPSIGKEYRELAAEAIEDGSKFILEEDRFPDADDLPPFNLTHVRRLTDDTGIVQHAKYGVPNLKEGYCLDDNARAVIMCVMAYRQLKLPETLDLLPVYVSYLHYMQTDDGNFRNFLNFSRKYLDDVGSEDSYGRTIWALGFMIRFSPNNSYREFGQELYHRSLTHVHKLTHVRGFANVIIGISHYLRHYQGDEGMLQLLISLTNKLIKKYNENSENGWCWFEDVLTYDNGILPLALLYSFEVTGNTETKQIAVQAIEFLKEKTLYKSYLTPIGNERWYRKGDEEIPLFDQQAIEVMAMVMMFEQAYQVTKDAEYIKNMFTSFMWFLGENELHIPLYDAETQGSCDGLESKGINRNQGAESTLAYFIAHLTVLKAMESEYEYKKPLRVTAGKTLVAQ